MGVARAESGRWAMADETAIPPAITALPTAASSLRTELRFGGNTGVPDGACARGPGSGLERGAGRSGIPAGLPLIKRVVTGEFTS